MQIGSLPRSKNAADEGSTVSSSSFVVLVLFLEPVCSPRLFGGGFFFPALNYLANYLVGTSVRKLKSIWGHYIFKLRVYICINDISNFLGYTNRHSKTARATVKWIIITTRKW